MLEFAVNHAGTIPRYIDRMETPGSRLRQLRKLRDLTLEQAAQIIGISAQALSQIERDDTKHIRPENLLKACAFYDVDPYQLILGKQKSEVAAELRVRRATRKA